MIYQNTETENTQNKFSDAISELKLGKLLRKSNITKNCGVPAYEVFQFLLLLVFQGKNLFRFLNSKHKDQAVSKNTYYRFLNDPSYNWKKFLLLLAARVTSAYDRLTRVYDHVEHKFQKGFTHLALGWSDGYSFIPVGFNLLSSASKGRNATIPLVGWIRENILCKVNEIVEISKQKYCGELLLGPDAATGNRNNLVILPCIEVMLSTQPKEIGE